MMAVTMKIWHTQDSANVIYEWSQRRINIACGVARNWECWADEEVVLAGGYDGEAVDTVEIYSFHHNTWRKGK